MSNLKEQNEVLDASHTLGGRRVQVKIPLSKVISLEYIKFNSKFIAS
jgi:hypothetical protein